MKPSTYALKLAGAAAVAGSTQAYGQIISITPPDNITNPSPSGAVTFQNEYYNVLTGATNTSGTPLPTDDFQFAYFISSGDYFSQSYVTGLKPTSLIASTYVPSQGYLYANALAKGARISDALEFNQVGVPGIYLTSVASDGTVVTPSNYQQPNTDEYLGFQFKDSEDGLIHNGWIELDSVTYPGANLSGVNFIAAAYDSIPDGQPGGDIFAGELPAAAPEPGTLSYLALGAAALGGVGFLRRRRAALVAAKD